MLWDSYTTGSPFSNWQTQDPDVVLVQHGHRRLPIEPWEKRETQQQKMVIIMLINSEPSTDWILCHTYPRKANGSMCVPRFEGFKVLIHEHCKAPTLDELMHRLLSFKIFSKLGTHNGFWSVPPQTWVFSIDYRQHPLESLPFSHDAVWP